MNIFTTTLIASIALAATSSMAFAQDAVSPMGGAGAMAAELPDICKTDTSTSGGMSGGMPMDMSHNMDEAHTDMMAGMDVTGKQMMDALMVKDIDVAFVCAMIPHHQAAINMAKAEIAHGDNAWAKDMAQKIIDAQQQEIAAMITWLGGEGANE
ncbi:MAG TPA: DUF305 domain-containing protein [Devosia sp.]|nr:DUF305 domain-containing protein [Devosia sp.]